MRYLKRSALISLFFTVFLVGCQNKGIKQNVDTAIQHTKAHFAPDSRVNRFDVQAKVHSDSLILSGITTVPEAKAALLDSLSSLNVTVADHIEILPAADLKDEIYGLVNCSVTNIRTKPS